MKLTPPSPQAGLGNAADRPVERSWERRPDEVAGDPAVATLAHDLRSPLSAVLGFARLAREELASGESARVALLIERIERSASTLDAILRSALGADTSVNAADLTSVLEQILAERKLDLERRGIRLVAPSFAPVLDVRPADLYRLLSNLIGNAIDHMGVARGARIAVSIACEGDVATLRVSDNGVGIAAEQRELVFEAAYTHCHGDAARRHRGLGLAIVRRLAASWGGCAWVEAEPRQGATLCVTIPVAS
ncbi:MAG TPA: HAMP domain-containing sensor histidine kinase [Myxococcota bacterium]